MLGLRLTAENPPRLMIAVDGDRFTRWQVGMDRLALWAERVRILGPLHILPAHVEAVAEQMANATGRSLPNHPGQIEVSFETGRHSRDVLAAMAGIAIADLKDPACSAVHPQLMTGLFGGRTEPPYLEQGIRVWEQDRLTLENGPVQPPIVNPV